MLSSDYTAEVLGLPSSARWRAWTNYKRSAKKRGHTFALDFDHFSDLISSLCHYCAAEPRNSLTVKDSGLVFVLRYQGIDRVNNARGYEPDNVVPCCMSCNSVKGQRSRTAFVEHAKRIAGCFNG